MVPTINLILLVTPGRIIDKRRDGWSSMLYLKKVKSEANVKANTKFLMSCFVVVVVDVYVKEVPSKLLHCCTVDFTIFFFCYGLPNFLGNWKLRYESPNYYP